MLKNCLCRSCCPFNRVNSDSLNGLHLGLSNFPLVFVFPFLIHMGGLADTFWGLGMPKVIFGVD